MRTSMKDFWQLERSSKRQVLGLLCVSALVVASIYTGSSIGTCPEPSGASSAEGFDAFANDIPSAVTPLAPVTQPPSYVLLDRITEKTDGLKSSPAPYQIEFQSTDYMKCSVEMLGFRQSLPLYQYTCEILPAFQAK